MKFYRIMHTTFCEYYRYKGNDSNLKHKNWSAGIKKITLIDT